MNEVKVLADFFFSRMEGKPIIDAAGRRLGKVKDVVILWDGVTPRVTSIKFQNRQQGLLPVELISSFGDDGLRLAVDADHLLTKPLLDNELYVGRWLLDKQIIDLKGSKLVRVNDITLSWVAHEDKRTLVLVAVDIGVRGLFRRLGLEFLVAKWSNHFIGLQYIKPLEVRTSKLQLNRDKEQLEQLHPADIADLIEEMDYKSRAGFIKSLDLEQAGEAISEMGLDSQVEVIAQMDVDHASDILEEMPRDEVANILSEMPQEKTEEILSLMATEEAKEVRELMEYPEDTAGGLMTTEYICLSPHLTADQAIKLLREMAIGAETIYYLYIVDEKEKLLGVMSLRELILASPDSSLESVMEDKVILVRPYDDHRKVAETISKYGLLAVPVADDDGTMLGIVTVDDILQLLMPERSGFDAGLLFRGSKLASRRW
ncbi:MAG TPA: CBS domain-containing protein [Methylomusa anaerophila]|uniref:Magnesium transporter MgtE n=1 Tax=Methylomusa anaerophila TaxID=1930071 RepID=A0A348AH39_9FIRM|nr:CBS domain-containing protein [Methylomusa anaerophila]BBB90387.1 magnesium transporter MgtE [Methylomusa anaerophila]HML89266.1 CBS domain-containing protein [Methylomusa anaerophila]